MAIPEPVSYWKLDESSGNAADSKGSNTLTNNNIVTYLSAVINNGANFVSATSQSLSIADASQTGLDFSDVMSLAGWIRFTTIPADTIPVIIKREPASNQRSYSLYTTGTGNTINFDSFTDGSSVGCSVSVAWTASTLTWYHLGFTKNGTSIKFYVDGSQQGTTQTGSNGAIFDSTAVFQMGGWASQSLFLNGRTDEWGAWNVELSSADMTALYNGGAGQSYPFPSAASLPFRSLLGVGK